MSETKLYVVRETDPHQRLIPGDVYEAERTGPLSVYITVRDNEGRNGYLASRFREITLDDAYSRTHWLDGAVTPSTSRIAKAIDDKVFEAAKAAGLSVNDATALAAEKIKATDVQVGGAHYKAKPIQPVEYAHANGMGFLDGSVVKYITRYKDKGGKQDLEKAKHFIDMLIQLEYPK